LQTEQLTSAATRLTPPSVRGDLNGLGGLAVALVVVFGVWSGQVSAGVDVLLVLFGFFVGARLLRIATQDNPGVLLRSAFTRLARRLLPALVVVVAVSGALTVWLQPRTRWETFADHSLSTFGFIQNWQLAHSAGTYARASEAVSPLQHLWAVSVLGQFLAAILVVTWLITLAVPTHRRRATLVAVVVVAAVASFGYAVVSHQADQTLAYYDSFARVWEPLAGVIAAAVVAHVRWPGWLRVGVAAAGLTAIVTVSLLVDGAEQYPGPLALIPVAAAVLIICSAANLGDTVRFPWPNRVLHATPLVGLGAMAYALYLWHWPLLILWLVYAEKDSADLTDGTAVILLSTALAYLTHQLVERPLRVAPPSAQRSRVPAIATAWVVVLLAVVVAVGSVGWRQVTNTVRANGAELLNLSAVDYPGGRALVEGLRVPKLPMRPTVLEAADDLPATIVDGCISDFGNTAVIKCAYGNSRATRTIALVGGSHSEHWLTALNRLGQQHGFKIVTYLKMGCPLTTDELPRVSVSNDPYPGCRDWVDSVMSSLVADRPDFVFTTTTRPLPDAPGDFVPDSYLGIWDTLAANDIAILGIRDTPWMYQDGVVFSPVDCLANGGDPESCGLPRSEVLASYNPTLDYLGRYPGILPLDLSDAVCGPDFCRAAEGNVLVYHDAHHLTSTYVQTLTDELARQLSEATNWW
jgi:peptidoglycan/LPS O-acetylase OafA/YrhL